MSVLVNCPTCSNPTSSQAASCPKCGEPLVPGWADEAIEAQRREAELAENSAKAARQAILALEERKRKRRSRLRWVLFWLVAGPIGLLYYGATYDSRRIERLKREDPAAYKTLMQQREVERKARGYEQYARAELEEKEKAEELRMIKEAEQIESKKRDVKLAEKRKAGLHCLSGWDERHLGVEEFVKQHLRDPDSYEHIATNISPVDRNGMHSLTMEYRAADGLGGKNIAIAQASVRSKDCQATIIKAE